MGTALGRSLVVAALALAIAPTAGAARTVCPTGSGSCVIHDPNNFSLTTNIGPISPFEVITMKGTARYEVKNGRRTFVVSVKGLDPLDGRPLDLLVGDVFQSELVVSPSGTVDYSVDTALGDPVPVAAPGTQVVFLDGGFVMGGGDLHA